MSRLCPIRGQGQSPCIQDECALWIDERRVPVDKRSAVVFAGRCGLTSVVPDRAISRAARDGGDGIAIDYGKALAAFPSPGDAQNHRILTPSEISVFRLVGLGLTNDEIAEKLCVSPLTVRTHVKRVHAKCDIAGRARLAIVGRCIWQGDRTPNK